MNQEKSTIRDFVRVKYIGVGVLFLGALCIAFFLGQFKNQLLYPAFGIPKDQFVCFSFNNLTQSYQTNCFLPQSAQAFHFHMHLQCQAYTNQQFTDEIWRAGDAPRKAITFDKSEYVHFTLDFHQNHIDGGSQNTGPYQILRASNDIIQAIRPATSEALTNANSYDFITFSKNTGQGMEVWHNVAKYGNTDSIASFFFQCQ